jgi:hypothetical protein
MLTLRFRNLPGYPLGERDRKVTVIQQDVTSPDVLTVEDVQTTRKESYINAASHIPANHRETFSINRNDAQLIPCYVWGNMNQVQPLTIKLHSGDRKKPSGFEFFNRKGMRSEIYTANHGSSSDTSRYV